MSEHKKSNKFNKELEDSHDINDNNQPIFKNILSLLIAIISNQEPLRYGNSTKLGLTPIEYGAR